MKMPKRLRLDSLVFSKEGLPVCPRNAAGHWLGAGKDCPVSLGPHQPARVLMFTPHRLTKDG